MLSLALAVSLVYLATALASPVNETLNAPRKIGKRCTGIIESLADVPAAQECLTINIAGFTVPAGETFALAPPDGAVVSMTGQITFAFQEWAGPLMKITGNSITFNGNKLHRKLHFHLKKQADTDTQATISPGMAINTGMVLGLAQAFKKPDPMLVVAMSGTFENVQIVNSPGRAVAIEGSSLTVSGVNVNNAAGAVPNSRSNGAPAGANTDGFDVAANNVRIQNSVDDCLAINGGTNIVFTGNSCTGGHGISIGSINSNTIVSTVTISDNVVINNGNGLRIKTDATATGSTVSNVIYTGNTLSGITGFGVLIDQSYPAVLGTPGTGVIIDGVTFSGTNTISVDSTAHRVEVNCGSNSCVGTWSENFAGLTVSGGTGSTVKNAPVTGGSF
ncbi:Glycoside hydrolase family 31 protein [Mycena sanguinolenta]|uniref:endo-polygalacturonase n=1 Tax=Mycena sanguinolenta TaxID=230812 RepID=A0A8H7CYI5_9AGAR|nr:Glycoside hydrolase family 31 protein [Mycena sanguinolenta]